MAEILSGQKIRGNVHSASTKVIFAAVASLQFGTICNFQAHASEGSFEDFPFLVHCEFKGLHRAYYLSTVSPDGIAVYISPDRQAGTITTRGKAEPVGGDGSGNCVGKTLEQLRSTGQAFDLKR